jgi:hypothetical protein
VPQGIKMPRGANTELLSFRITPALKFALEAEAWEEQVKLSDYVRGLLERRGKWSRSVGRPGGYDIALPAKVKE